MVLHIHLCHWFECGVKAEALYLWEITRIRESPDEKKNFDIFAHHPQRKIPIYSPKNVIKTLSKIFSKTVILSKTVKTTF